MNVRVVLNVNLYTVFKFGWYSAVVAVRRICAKYQHLLTNDQAPDSSFLKVENSSKFGGSNTLPYWQGS